jgi:hypothetical protein
MGGSTLGLPKKQLQQLKINRKTKSPNMCQEITKMCKKSLGIFYFIFWLVLLQEDTR